MPTNSTQLFRFEETLNIKRRQYYESKRSNNGRTIRNSNQITITSRADCSNGAEAVRYQKPYALEAVNNRLCTFNQFNFYSIFSVLRKYVIAFIIFLYKFCTDEVSQSKDIRPHRYASDNENGV